MTKKYLIKTLKITIQASYISGKLKRIEIKRGSFAKPVIDMLGKFVPVLESEIPHFKNHFYGQAEYQLQSAVTKDSQFSVFRDAWFELCTSLLGVKPKFGPIDGKYLSEIIKHLNDINSNEDEANATWLMIMSRWKELDSFTQKKLELSYVNRNINNVILQLKNEQTSQSKAADNQSDFRGKFKNGNP